MRSFYQDRLGTNMGKTRRFVRTGVTLSLQPWQYDEQKASDVIAALTTCQSMKPACKKTTFHSQPFPVVSRACLGKLIVFIYDLREDRGVSTPVPPCSLASVMLPSPSADVSSDSSRRCAGIMLAHVALSCVSSPPRKQKHRRFLTKVRLSRACLGKNQRFF
eukprot:COSAG06_NODE_2517_length_6730_cov_5.273413_7_plen_162_part_00